MNKKCNTCGKVHTEIPKDAIFDLGAIVPGYYFNCECHSTLVVPFGGKIKEALTEYEKEYALAKASDPTNRKVG